MTLKFNRVREVVKVHVRAKYHQAECSGSLVIVLTEKEKNSDENNTVIATARTVTSIIRSTMNLNQNTIGANLKSNV